MENRNSTLPKKIGLRLQTLREKKGMKREDFAGHNFSVQHYSKIERGDGNPTIVTLERISNILEISLEELLNFSDHYANPSEETERLSLLMEKIYRKNDKNTIRHLLYVLEEMLGMK